MSKLDWLEDPIPAPDAEAAASAAARQARLTKPAGSLGRLEAVAIQLAACQSRERPCIERVRICVFAADHGVTAEGVSAYPQSVTAEMVRNFVHGGAAISVLAAELGAELEVVNLGTVEDLPELPGVVGRPIGPGTASFLREPAMTEAQLAQALDAGREAVLRAQGIDLFVGGEMGIGNTTAAAAVACALLGEPAAALVGAGTGLDADGQRHKAALIDRALAFHRPSGPLRALQCVGGFEIAALAGAFIAAGQARLPVLVDGFIAGAAALAALRLRPALREWLVYGHRSAERGHRAVLAAVEAEPLLDLGMRLGEGSGAASALPLLRLACALHNGMATFDEAGVSEAE